MRAVIDIGTNSSRLIIVELQDNQLITIYRQLITTRIGQGIKQNKGKISQEAMERTLRALKQYNKILQDYPIESVDIIGTQALRESSNSDIIKQLIRHELGWEINIITGEREAYLSYLGAISALPELKQQAVVLDIGGGSTEIMFKDEQGIQGASVPIGCLRLLEESKDKKEIEKQLALDWQNIIIPENSVLIGVGGTATTMAAIHLNMYIYDPDLLLKANIKRQEVQAVLDHLESLNSEKRLELPGMFPGREDILPWGIRILLAVMDHFKLKELRVCDRDLMYGILLDKQKQ